MFECGKYITGEIDTEFGMPVPAAVCFSEAVKHDTFKKLFVEIWGAGFFVVNNGADGDVRVSVFGQSISLGIASRPDDEKMIRRALGMDSI